MRIEDRAGEALGEATVTLTPDEVVDLLEALADVAEGKTEHLHFAQAGGPELVVRRSGDGVRAQGADALARQMDWWLGPLVLLVAVLTVLGGITLVRWAIGLL